MPSPRSCLAAVLFVTTAAIPAQLSGVYTIDPSGSGGRNYRSFTAASFALFSFGIDGAVQFDVASGTYTDGFVLYPVIGASPANTVTFRSPVSRAAVFWLSAGGSRSSASPVFARDGWCSRGSSSAAQRADRRQGYGYSATT